MRAISLRLFYSRRQLQSKKGTDPYRLPAFVINMLLKYVVSLKYFCQNNGLQLNYCKTFFIYLLN